MSSDGSHDLWHRILGVLRVCGNHLEAAMQQADKEPLELRVLRTHLTSITDTVTVGDTLQWFANCLVEKKFIPRRAAQGILGTSGTAPARKAGQLMDSVFAVIGTSNRKRHWFLEFVSIFSTDQAYAELQGALKRCVNEDGNYQERPSQSNLSLVSPPVAGPATAFEQVSPHTTSSSSPVHGPPSSHQPSDPSFWSLEKVKATIPELEGTFADLHAEAGIQIRKLEAEDAMFLEKFRSRLLLLPVRKATLHVKFFQEYEDDILAAKDTKKILGILCRYVDYRNYEVFFHVVKFCGTSLQEKMKGYCEELEQFEKLTTVDVYICAIPEEANEEVKVGFSQMVMKIAKPASQCSLLEIRRLNKAIIKESTLCSHSVYIGAVSRNCVVVRLTFPSSAVGWVLAAMTPEFLTKHYLTEVTVDGSQLSDVQEVTERLVCVCTDAWHWSIVM